MKNINKNKVYKVKININNKIDEIIISGESLISELRQAILDKYLLSPFNYSIFYKNRKLSINDFIKVSNLFQDDLNPFLFIVNNNIILPDLQTDHNSIGIISNTNDKKITELLGKFFEYKSLPFNANIKTILKGKYKIKFNKPILANEFMQFYNLNNDKKIKLNNNISKFNELKLPKIKKNKFRSISSDYIMERNKKDNLINEVIRLNSRDTSITEKSVFSGINLFHNSLSNNNRKYKKNEYKGVSYLPFLNPDERYYREKLLDKKNWLDKKGFMVSVGNYKMGGNSHFIPNYVTATPSKSPLCHNFRDIQKDKWVNKKGFYL